MMNALKSIGQSVQSLGNKALAHPHWAGKTGFAALTLILLAVCAVVLVVLPLMFLVVAMVKNLGEGNTANFKYYDAVAEDHADTVGDQERCAEFLDD